MANVLSCKWDISINGKELSLNRYTCITNIEIEEICDGSDTCRIQLRDPDFAFIEDNIFVEEAKIKVTARVNDVKNGNIEFSGYISAIDISFPEEGYPSMTLHCLDNSHIMNRKKKDRTWDNVSTADVVRKIAQEYGFKCKIQDGYNFETQDNIAQSDETDIAFLESLAKGENDIFMCKLVGDTIYYVKKGLLENPVSTLAYRLYPYSVISFSPQINKETRQEEVEKANIDDNKTPESSKATDGNTPRDTQGDPVKTGGTGGGAMKYDAEKRTWTDTGATPQADKATESMTNFVDSIDWEQYK